MVAADSVLMRMGRVCLLVGGLALPGPAFAHPLQVTGVVVHAEKTSTSVTVMVHVPLLAGLDPAVAIPQHVHLRLDGVEFRPAYATVESDGANDTVTWSGTEARGAQTIVVESPVFPERSDDTTVVLVYRAQKLVDRVALNAAHPSATIGESLLGVVRRFVEMGVLHILSGPDHILFLIGLVLAGGTVRQLFGLVTAFTLAHSISLTLTALGIASVSPRIVEPIIALSIVFLAVENLFRRGSDYRVRVGLAFGFGIFHGFGFAGALSEVGLPQQAIGWSLGSFNAGVEIGQGCILLVVLPLLWLVARQSERTSELVMRYASVAIALAGAVWFVQRVSVG